MGNKNVPLEAALRHFVLWLPLVAETVTNTHLRIHHRTPVCHLLVIHTKHEQLYYILF